MRTPLPLKQWDLLACETACTAQLLYMHNIIEEREISAIDQRVGRRPGETDQVNGNLRLILESGFVVHSITSFSVEEIAGPNSLTYLAKAWRESGCSEEDIRTALPKLHPVLQSRARLSVELQRRFRTHYTRTSRRATGDDVREMLGTGWAVRCYVLNGAGCTHELLAFSYSHDQCRVYDPTTGEVTLRSIRSLMSGVLPHIEGYRMTLSA
jgi:hypothetical protein